MAVTSAEPVIESEKEQMAAKKYKRYSDSEKAAILAELASASQTATAKKHHISVGSLSNWMKAAGMNGGGKKVGAKKKAGKLGKKARRSASRTAANGHAPVSLTGAGLDGLHAQLSTALASVAAMREAFRNVFGGGG